MVRLAGGTFQMGSNTGVSNEKPVHAVTVRAFEMDLTEVTVAAYSKCVAAGGCTAASDTVDWKGIEDNDKKFWSPYCNQDKADRQRHPVNCVDWAQADTYCRWAGKRLPTEEEWEFAARGTAGRLYPWGEAPPGPTLLNACGDECVAFAKTLGKDWQKMFDGSDGFETTAPVGSFPAGKTPEGLLDMAGNVWEWTSSGYSKDYNEARTNEARVRRGGSWGNGSPSNVRGASRSRSGVGERGGDLGFRCAR